MRGLARLMLGILVLAGGIGLATLHSGAAEQTAIRAFDLATIERLGRAMYEQDQRAWKATDVMLDARTEAGATRDGVAGWITSEVAGKPTVRFIRNGERGPEVLYDVAFDGLKPGSLVVPSDRTLSMEEATQHAARRLGVSQIGQRCAERYNTIALNDTNGDWLVWVMTATLDKDVVPIGGNLRFTISPDGTIVRARDALSKSCLRLNKGDTPNGSQKTGLMFSHIVSLTPIETHVFANLTYGLPLFVGTQDGLAWKVDQGRIATVDMDEPGLEGFAARHLAGMAENCKVMVRHKDKPSEILTPDDIKVTVIRTTEGDEKFAPSVPSQFTLEAVMCVRLDIVPAPNDYKVVMAGYPLFIIDKGLGHGERMGVLEVSNGQLRFRMEEGSLTPEVEKRLGKRLDAMQLKAQAKT